jgi:hypothetical protein
MSPKHSSLAVARAAAGVFILSLALLACGRFSPDVATVNGDGISAAELKRQVRVFQSVRPGAPDDADTRGQVLDQLIKQRLLVQMARQQGLDKDPKIQQAIAERRQGLRAELQKSIADAQVQLAGLDNAVESRTLIEALSQAQRVGMTVTQAQLQAAYKARAAQATLPPFGQVRDQILEQVILDRLVEKARQGAKIDLKPDALK